ncbi:MAG: ATP-binding protein [Candidatus Brocadiales bacterium]|nr:ATP-binding protein [Candidatus Bathyanammoxibius amoris]
MNLTKDLFHEELVERLFWFIRLRWLAAGGALTAILLANMGGLIESLTPLAFFTLLLLGLNVLFYLHATRVRKDPVWVTNNVRVQILCDLAILTLLIHYSGGVENPFLFFFVFHTILASILLERRESYIFAFTAIFLVGTMVLLEYSGILQHHCMLLHNPVMGINVPDLWKNPVYLVITFFVFSTALLICTYLTGSVAAKLRERSRKLRALQEELLRVEKDKWRAVLECMREGIVFVDNEGKIAFFNASASGIKDTALKACRPDGELKCLENGPELYGKGDSSDFSRTVEVDGRIYESTCSSINDSEGRHLGKVIVSRDITERKEMERKLVHQEKMTVVGRMAAGIAHELNNPLGVISMFTQIAMKKVLPDEPVHEYLDTIGRNTDVCKKVIQGLLTYARTGPTLRESIDLNECIMDVLFMCKPLMDKQNVTLVTGLDKNLPKYEGDPDQLRQVFMNLAINGIHAMEDGGQLRVLTEVSSGINSARSIRVVFKDMGKGIPQKDLSRIFEPFFTTKPEGVGTGLGLSICKNFLEGHGGTIFVDSEEGKGSQFIIILPLEKTVRQLEGAPAEKSAGLV